MSELPLTRTMSELKFFFTIGGEGVSQTTCPCYPGQDVRRQIQGQTNISSLPRLQWQLFSEGWRTDSLVSWSTVYFWECTEKRCSFWQEIPQIELQGCYLCGNIENEWGEEDTKGRTRHSQLGFRWRRCWFFKRSQVQIKSNFLMSVWNVLFVLWM